jgi:ABC-2 type transport system permease protein
MVLMLGLLGGALLPDNWQWVVYWVPIYWTFDVAEEIFTLTATWDAVAWKSGVALGISLLAYGVLQKRIARGLS